MPELPEVETIRRQLAPHVEGRTLRELRILDPRWTQPLAPQAVVDALQGRAVAALERRGKYLIWRAEGDVHLLIHLRMTGTLLWEPTDDAAAHERVRFDLDGGRLSFCDPRRFGTGELAIGGPALSEFLDARLGVEPFDGAFTGAYLRAQAQGRRAPVRRSCSTSGVSRAWGTSTPTRRCFAPASIRCGRWARSLVPSARRCATASSRRCRRGSTLAGRRSMTSATSTACTAAFSTTSSCTGGAARRVTCAAARS